ncbi:hypothetical protein [Paracoccus saliphilus]|uniref:Uncharacterized protein n=1 Tax=Paracoccus saliphilus TaxID=405559 RepID=A0AA45W608_9RHOB|nr:hypothetical protein [Paracoccus saliphilus]WCR01660.1 hypothetical protein JHX88_12030 [Paracoccus saliphilus]SIS98189.1 hypothetical protein SAMN05421772_1118 [Paracoccus saliphilus]
MSGTEKHRVAPMRHPIEPLPIDLPAVEDHEVPSPLQSIKARDLIFIAVGMFGTFAGGALAARWLK